MRKRILSMLLAITMVTGLLPSFTFTALAAETDNLCEHHAEHTAECGYVEGVSDCAYHCDVCLGHDHGDGVTVEDTEPAPVCDCGTDDESIHATTCAVYVAPENPQCYCAEKCTEVNEWCDVCGFDYSKCGGTDSAVVYADEDYTYDEATNTYTVRTADALYTAISTAGTSGTTDNPATIKLAANVEVAGTPDEYGIVNQAILVDNGVITLDLNGHTVTSAGEAFYVINVDNGATLTIDDSSEGNQGKIKTVHSAVCSYKGKLVINGGTFEGNYAVEGLSNNSSIEINGGTFIATQIAIQAGNSVLTITGGTFTGGRSALSLTEWGTYSITGGSFSGGEYDIDTGGAKGFLSYNEGTGVGPTFPGGLSIWTDEYTGLNLNALLAEYAAYYDANVEKIDLEDSAASYDGDVTVECEHLAEENTDTNCQGSPCVYCGRYFGYKNFDNHVSNEVTYTPNAEDSSKHDKKYVCCGTVVTEDHTGGTATCTEQAECQHCGASYGEMAAHTPDANGKCTVENCGYQYPAKVGDTFYESIHKALRAAEGISGCTLTLLDDIILTSSSSTAPYVNKGTITLDLNGNTISSNASTLQVMNTANLTIKDSVGGGKIVSTYSNAIYQTGGKVTIEGGTFEGTLDGVFLSYDSTLIVKGGTFTGGRAMITGFGSDCEIDLTAIDPAGFTLKNNGSGTFAPTLPSGYAMVNGSGTVVTSLSAEESATVKASLENATVTLDKDTFTYDGKEHKPTVTVVLGDKPLTLDVDYTVIYAQAMAVQDGKPFKWFGTGPSESECINAGSFYFVVVEGIGNYYTEDTFTLCENFVIAPRPLTVKADDQTILVGGQINEESVTVTEGSLVAGHTLTASIQLGQYTEAGSVVNQPGFHEDVLTILKLSCDIMDGEEYVTDNYSISFVSGNLTVVEHVHEWSYSADGATITAECKGTIGTCPVENKTVAIKLNALENLTYDGNAKIVTVTQSPAGVFTDIPAVTYGASGNVNAGKHTASLTYGEKTATLEFTIAAATPTVAWNNTTASVEYTGSAASITAPTVTLVNGETFNGTISYSYTGTSSGSGLPTNAGTYEITASIDAQGNYNAATSTNKLMLTINKVASSCTAPEAVSGLTFNGGNQNLITAGTAIGGTMQYSLDGSNWSETIPTGKDTKTYTVYYKVVGDGNHEDNAGGTVSVTIAKGAAPTVSIPVQQHVCTVVTTGNEIDLASYLPADRGATTYGDPVVTGAFFKDGTAISDGVLTYGTNVTDGAAEGSIAVTVTMANYEPVTVTVPVKLTAKAIVTVTVPTVQNGTYNGQSHVGYIGQPSVADYAGDFEITYTGRNGTVYEATDAAPINAGDYTVTFKIPDSDLYMTGSGSVEFSVTKAVITITADNKSAYRNDSVPELTCKVEGLVAGETLTTVPTVSTDADMTTTGTYAITVSGAEASDNYTITYVAGVLTVSKRPSSGSNTPAPSTEVQVPISGEDETIHVDAEVKGDKATIDHVDLNKLDEVIGDHVEEVGTITIDFSDLDSKKPITTVEIPSNVVKEIADAVADPSNDAHSFEVILSDGLSIEFDAEALGEKAAQADGLDITISIRNSKEAKPNKKQEAALNGRPAYDITVTSGGEHISDMGGKITIHAPYELQDGEHPRGIVVWYVDEDGKRERCETSYDPVKKRVNWKTDHLSLYMIGYDETLAKLPFTDVKEDDACFDAVAFMYENGLMVGVGDGTQFAPGMSLSRAMIAQILYRYEGQPDAAASSFTDVLRNFWYTDAIDWASAEGVIVGNGQGSFFPNQDVTREQLAVMLYQYAKAKGYDIALGDKLTQPDAANVSFWAAEAVQWAVNNGILVENGVGYLAAGDPATRADVAEAFMAFVNLYA